jgi:mannose-6-phosphate isomerase-like protein (cupin superfamily)
MTIHAINDTRNGFEVLRTTGRSQTAVMLLAAGESSSEEMSVHQKSDQVLLVVEGEVVADVAGEKRTMRKGDVCTVPAGAPHRFKNHGKSRVATFNVYAPPAYPAGEKD